MNTGGKAESEDARFPSIGAVRLAARPPAPCVVPTSSSYGHNDAGTMEIAHGSARSILHGRSVRALGESCPEVPEEMDKAGLRRKRELSPPLTCGSSVA